MALDASIVEQALVSPAIWWVYELMAVFCYEIISVFGRYGRDKHLIGDIDKMGTFTELAHKYVEPTKANFKTRAGRGFSTERGRFGFIEGGFGGGHHRGIQEAGEGTRFRSGRGSRTKLGNPYTSLADS